MFEDKKNRDDDQFFSLNTEESPNTIVSQSSETLSETGSERNVASFEALPEIKDNPKIGVLWYIIYTLKITAILYITKIIYALNPGIEVLQIVALKSSISSILLLIVFNYKLKYVMYDCIDPEAKWALAFKTVQTTISVFIAYYAIKYFEVSTTGAVCSLTPLVACLLAAIILKERLTFWTMFSIAIVLSCVMMVVFGANGEEAEAMSSNILAVIALCSQPFLLAGGMIANRAMKKNHPVAVTCYSNILLGISAIIGIQFNENLSFDYLYELSAWSFVLIGFAGVLTIFENTAKFMAFRYEEAAKLQKLAFLPNVWAFSVDGLVFNAEFGALQLAGFMCLFVFYFFELISFYFCETTH